MIHSNIESIGDIFNHLIDLSLQRNLNDTQSPAVSEESTEGPDEELDEMISTVDDKRSMSNRLINRKDFCIESVMDSMFNYGVMHGRHIQQLQLNKSVVHTNSIYGRSYGSLNHIYTGPGEIQELKRKIKPSVPRRPAKKIERKHIHMEQPSHFMNSNNVVNSRHKFIGVTSDYVIDKVVHEVSIVVGQHIVQIGTFDRLEDAIRAHDRALIRAIGPTKCSGNMLNFPILSYKNDPESLFSVYDHLLNKALVMDTDWTGPKACDNEVLFTQPRIAGPSSFTVGMLPEGANPRYCLLYTSDAADE